MVEQFVRQTKMNISKITVIKSQTDSAGTTNLGGTWKPNNLLKEIRNPIPQDPDNPLKGIQDLVKNETQSQWPRGLTIPI